MTEASKGHILVVDDNDAIRDIVADALELHGYVVRTAADGQQALECADSETRLILLDLMMPGVDGERVAERLARKGCRAPILVVTADRLGGERAQGMGVAGFLAKPFDLAALLQAVRRGLGETTD